MESIASSAGLKNAVDLLEVEQSIKKQLLIQQLHRTYESFKPVNLLKRSLNDIVSSPYLIDNILGTALGLASGYLSKRLVVGASVNLIRRLFGFATELGVTSVVSQHPGAIKSIGRYIHQHFINKIKAEL